MSTRSDRGMKLMTNKVVDLERTVQNVKHFCNATARSQAEQLISMQQMQNDGTKGCNGLTQTDSLIDNINKNIAFQIGNVTHKLNNWYSDLWRRSSNLETLLKNENNQSRWEVYDGIMQILSRWDITEESIHEIENNIKERFMDLSSKHKEIIKSISDKENKLAGILDGFLDVLVYNATRALSEFQLTHEMIKSHNSNMGRTVDTTNKLVLSCQEDNKALKGALLQTGAQYKMDWDTKHDKLQANINSTQLHISKIQSLLENFLQESKNNTKDTLEILNKKMTEATNLISSKCTQINETDKYNQGHSNINIELKNITLTTPLSSQNRPNDVSVDAVSEEILSNATQVQNFLSGFKNAIEEVSFNSNVNKSQQNNFHTSDYADSFGPEVQDYDDVEEEYTE